MIDKNFYINLIHLSYWFVLSHGLALQWLNKYEKVPEKEP